MIRGILALLFAVLYCIIGLPSILIVLILEKINYEVREKFVMAWVQAAFRGINFFAGVKVEAVGLENIPADRACLFIGNHRSYFDVITTYTLFKRPTSYLSKAEFRKVPILEIWMKFIHCRFLVRDDPKQGLETIMGCIEDIKKGISVFVFPEGTRNREDGSLLPFHAGSFKIAVRSGAPIVPVAIMGAGDLVDNHMPVMHPHKVIVQFGKPLETSQVKPAERKNIPLLVENELRGMLVAGGELPPVEAERKNV